MDGSKNKLNEDNQRDEISIYDMVDDVFNNAKQKIKVNIQNYTNCFKINMEQTIRKVMDEKLFDIKNSIDEIKTEMGEIKSQTESMYTIINQLHNSIQKNGFVPSNVDIIKKLDNQNAEPNLIKKDIKKEIKKEIKKDNHDKEKKINPNPIIDEEEEIIKIKFEKKKIDKLLDIKDAKFFNIENIAITNISKKTPLKKLQFIKDNKNSSNDINFYDNSKKLDELDFNLSGELSPKSTEKNISVPLNITNPKPDKSYKIVIYIREKDKDINISEPLEINVKIKKAEDPEQQRKNKANKIYEEIKNEYPNHGKLINKSDIINKLLKNNLNKDEIKKEINAKIKDNEKKEKEEKAESIYNKLYLNDIEIDKQEIIDIIIKKKFNTTEVQNWIYKKIEEQNKENAQKIYDKLSKLKEIDFSKESKEDVLNVIIELKFNEDEIKEKYKKEEEEKKEEENKEEEKRGDEEKVDELSNYLEENYGISSFVEEEVIKAKIRELEYDKDEISKWADDVLINGGY